MSGLSAFYSAVSGLKGQLFSMSVVGNNIANVNTTGFKNGRATFQEMLVQTWRPASGPRGSLGGTNPVQVGLGMEVRGVSTDRSPGMMQTTGITTDLAIDGDGYFVLHDGQSRYYSRSGSFQLDQAGQLVSPGTGMLVQGWMADADGKIRAGAPIENLVLPFGVTSPARATTRVAFSGNLNAQASTSTASLASAGTTGIGSVSGTATNGAGGTHEVVITGVNATASTNVGDNTGGAPLTGAETLASLGVTDPSDFQLVVDGSETFDVDGLTTGSTVIDLINSINALNAGVTAELDATGEVRLTRDYAGDGTIRNVATSVGVAGNITAQVFTNGAATQFVANSGTASTLQAIDTFTPTGRTAVTPRLLTLTTDELTGLVTGISDLGGGGVTVEAQSELAAGTATITTEDTSHLMSVIAYDTLGDAHTLNMSFRRGAEDNLWYWEAGLGGEEEVLAGNTGTIRFNQDGSFRSFESDAGTDSLSVNPNTGAERLSVELETGTAGLFDGMTQFSSPFSTRTIEQDGYGMGDLSSISIDQTGMITGLFTNGTIRDLAQIVLATFRNEEGLERLGGSVARATQNSGEPLLGAAGSNAAGEMVSGALEMSNVDLAEEFTRMIVAQRGFQANARVITSADEVLVDLMNVKR